MAGLKDVATPPSLSFLRARELYCSSSMIPFCETPASSALFAWINSWSQACPACLLIGPIGSGKTRLIQHLAVKLGLYIIETDCASVASLKEVVQKSEESTQSHSVGVFSDSSKTELAAVSSVVVFEHIDALVSDSAPLPRVMANLMSNSRVPILMTANHACIPESSFVHYIWVDKMERPFDALKGALWMRGSGNSLLATQQILNLLNITDNDVRRTALQFQVFPSPEQVIDERERLFLSVPTLVSEREGDPEWYSLLCDVVCSSDCGDAAFRRYMRPCSARLFSSERETLAGEYYNRTCEMIQFTSGSADTEMMVSFLVDACHNTTKVTRRRCVPPFSGKNTFSNGNVAEVLTWKWWPHAARDLDPPSTCDKL